MIKYTQKINDEYIVVDILKLGLIGMLGNKITHNND